ncbi:MAG: MMPL family transporter [Candidatus Aminicenantes bacterium]|nr:MMPL family transporter [Candidatus Aminicenantes bacterium]
MRDKILLKLAHWHSSHPGRMLIIVFILTILLGWLFAHLKQTMRWSDLLPAKDTRTVEFNRIIEEFVSATSIVVVVEGEEDRIKSFAEQAVPKILAARDPKDNQLCARRVDYKQEIDFLKNHGFMLMKAEDLENLKDIFKDPHLLPLLTNINNSFEKEYIQREESISTREKEDSAVGFLHGLLEWVESIREYALETSLSKDSAKKAVDNLILGEPYFLSYDRSVLILNIIPNFTMMDAAKLVSGTEAIQDVVDEILKDFPDVTAGLTGMIPLGHDEMVYAEKSLGYTTLIAIIAIIILLIVSFRMWVAPLLAVISLLVGVIWAGGTVFLLVRQLNIMTSMFVVILLGLGIDFSIHIISSFTEARSLGKSIEKSMEEAFLKSGKGILSGALTTACAFLTLTISSSRGMKEMGLVTGSGLLCILLVTFLLLPSLLVIRERRLEKRRKKGKEKGLWIRTDISFRFLGKATEFMGRHFITTLIASLVVTVLLIFFATRITFDQNYMNIEPKGLTSILLQDTVLEKFDLGMDYALILASSPDESRKIAKASRELASVAMTEDISFYLPSEEEQKKRLPHIIEIREAILSGSSASSVKAAHIDDLLKELQRLDMNIKELQDMAYLGGQDKVEKKCSGIVGSPEDPSLKNRIEDLVLLLEKNKSQASKGLERFERDYVPYFKETVTNMSSPDKITLDMLPLSVLDRYSNQERETFLVTVFPAGNIWQDAEYLRRFTEDLKKISDRATGFPPIFRALIEIIGRDGLNAALLTLLIVFLLLTLDYANPGKALMAMIPLAFGLFWMVGLMKLVGMQLTVVNVMGIPLIIGIGIDDGVHIIHRWRREGRGKLRIIFASTGKAIFLTSLTTMLAFGSLIFSVWRGFGQLGGALAIGVGTCFLTTVIILPGIIGFLERKKKSRPEHTQQERDPGSES